MSSVSHSLLLILSMLSASVAAPQQSPTFQNDILPVLRNRCGKCHSARTREGELNLLSKAGLQAGGESGEPLFEEESSLFLQRIAEGEMPPEGEPPLAASELKLIRRWVKTGAAARFAVRDERVHQHQILPVVLLRCATCHGAQRTMGGFDARTVVSMRRGGKSGPAIVQGDPDNSLMIQRIESHACPPRSQLLKYFVRRPEKSETELLRKWISAGTPIVDIVPDVATTDPDPLVTDEDRQHWSFRPLSVSDHDPQLSPDDFINRRLSKAGLSMAPRASRSTLIRRAWFDLTGLPPGVDDWQRWRADPSRDWFARMVDHLLASPGYGERWGRYWLDVAGYSDSEGGVSADPVRAVAWKYRDYVINALNADKPYDQFLIEQLAGDELLDVENASVVTPEMVEYLTATGFLRMSIDQTGSRTMNYVPERLGVIDDAMNVVASSVMGLTIACARCHSHKYDPIPQRDYYRFKAVFQGAFDEHDWLTFRNRFRDIDTPERVQHVREVNPALQKQLNKLESARRAAELSVNLELLRHHYPAQSEDDRIETLKALKIADNNRNQTQRTLVEMLQTVQVIPFNRQPDTVREAQGHLDRMVREIKSVRRQMAPPVRIRALWDRGEPSPTYLLRRGEHTLASTLVGPGVPSVLTDGRTPFPCEPPFPDGTPKTGRRLALARWLTQPNHPLTARVMANRVWQHHFGAGLVRTPENFGLQGEAPTHPELLDWLAASFVSSGWSLKQLHRTILLSETWKQSSRVSEQAENADPQNRLWSHAQLRRLDAEAVRDSLLSISGRLDLTPGGPPDTVTTALDGEVTADALPSGNWRRSVYLQLRRTEMPSLLKTFDYPEMGPNCVTRTVSVVSPQSLLLLNNRRVRELSDSFATRVLNAADGDPVTQMKIAWQRAFGRSPEDQELMSAQSAMNALVQAWDGNKEAAFRTWCHTLLNSAEFLYVD